MVSLVLPNSLPCLVKTLGYRCGRVAEWRPVLLFPKADLSLKSEPMRADLEFVSCDECHFGLTVQDFLGDAAWERFKLAMLKTNRTPPRRTKVTLEWVRLGAKKL